MHECLEHACVGHVRVCMFMHVHVQVWDTDNRLFEAGGKLRVQFETMVAPRALREFAFD